MERPGAPAADCCAPTYRPHEDVDQDLAGLAKALGHPARVAIVRFLAETTGCCGQIVSVLDLPQSTVSQHLKVLKDAGLVVGEVEGTRVCYCLDRNTLKRLRVLIAEIG
jgi:DNA-binding transcriptional ArsR family regulator